MAIEWDIEFMLPIFSYEIFPGEEYSFKVHISNASERDLVRIDHEIEKMLHAQKVRAIEDSKI